MPQGKSSRLWCAPHWRTSAPVLSHIEPQRTPGTPSKIKPQSRFDAFHGPENQTGFGAHLALGKRDFSAEIRGYVRSSEVSELFSRHFDQKVSRKSPLISANLLLQAPVVTPDNPARSESNSPPGPRTTRMPRPPSATLLQVLRLPQVCKVTRPCRSMIYRLEIAQRFPHRVKIGVRAVGWVEGEVQEWLAHRIKRSRDSMTSAAGHGCQ